jgi:carboxymethylenebutenolidase
VLEIETPSGISFEIYVRGPEDASKGVLIIHDWWGLRSYNRQWVGHFAELSYRAAVVDLYDGQVPSDPGDAGQIMRSIDQDQANEKLSTALNFLKTANRKVATLGWSFGGMQALRASLLDADVVAATVMFYSRIISDPEVLKALRSPVLAIFSENERTWQEKKEKFQRAMKLAGKQLEVASFPADHGFANPDSEHHDAEATQASWKLTLDFLDKHLT